MDYSGFPVMLLSCSGLTRRSEFQRARCPPDSFWALALSGLILVFGLSWPNLDDLPPILFLQGQELLSLENELKVSQQVL